MGFPAATMKYFAILKDSLREALDSKVLYVLMGLSLVIILFVATIGFRPLPAEKTMEKIVDGTIVVFMDAFKPEGTDRKRKKQAKQEEFDFAGGVYRLEKVEAKNGPADSPDADYLLTISKMFINDEAAAKARQQPESEIQAVRRHFGRMEQHGFYHIGAVRVPPGEPRKDVEVDLEVEFQATRGTRRLWLHEPSVFFGLLPLDELAAPLGFQLFIVADFVLSLGAWVAVLLGVIMTSFFIPNMLQKGTIDLLLVKPIRRSILLVFKYIGGLTFILLVNAFAIVGIWLVLGLRSGVWAYWVLLLVPLLTFFFAILYAVSTLFAVLTRSTVAAILVTIGAWFSFFVVGALNQFFENMAHMEETAKVPLEKRRFSDNTFGTVVNVIHRVLPRTSDLDQLADLLIFSDFMTGGYLAPEKVLPAERNWWESFGVSLAFIVIMLGLACWRFAVKDY